MPTSAPASGTARGSASRTWSCTARRRRSRESPSTTPTRATRARTRSRPACRSKEQPGHLDSGDRHALIVDRDSCKLYELYALQRNGSRWTAGSGAIWNLRSNALRPATWTSADAAGLPILPGLARWDGDASTGRIDHALRFTVQRSRNTFIYPARHQASSSSDPSLPPMGLRVRLKASVDISKLPPQARIVAQAMKTYGMIVADNGSNWYVSGAPSPKWSNDQLHALGALHGSDFEVVDTSKLRP